MDFASFDVCPMLDTGLPFSPVPGVITLRKCLHKSCPCWNLIGRKVQENRQKKPALQRELKIYETCLQAPVKNERIMAPVLHGT